MDKIAWLEEELRTLRGRLSYQHELAALRDDQLQKLREENKGLRALAGRLTDNGGRAGELDSTSEKADAATQTFVSPPCANKVARVVTCAAQCYGPLCEKGSLVELPNCSHMIHLDCLMLTLAVTHSAVCPICRAPLAKSEDAQAKLSSFVSASVELARSTLDYEVAEAAARAPSPPALHGLSRSQVRAQLASQAADDALFNSDHAPINPNV